MLDWLVGLTQDLVISYYIGKPIRKEMVANNLDEWSWTYVVSHLI